jgi:uncharacterized RDD family membrane protein YckC/uncharacterized membrane protein
VVGLGQLVSDVVEGSVTLLLPALLWLFLYLFIWEDPQVARRLGFTRLVFWLLLPVGLAGWALGNVPIFGYKGDLLAVNVGGAMIPVVLSIWLLSRELPRPASTIGYFLAVLAPVCAVDTVAAVFIDQGTLSGYLLLVGLVAAAAAIATLVSYLRARGDLGPEGVSWQRVTFLVLLTTGGIVGTFATTIATPAGISSAFPYFLVTPLVVGVVAAWLVPRWPSLLWSREVGLPLAYATATFGTLLGADLLRQPPLYAITHGVVFSIGGAGLEDLVYLAPLLALVAAFGVYRLDRRPAERVEHHPDPGPTPLAGLRRAQGFNRLGRPAEGIRYSATAAHDAVIQLRRLASLGSVPPGTNPWDGLAVPPWVVADQANLEALARAPPADPIMAHRAWMTARFLVHLSTVLSRPRFAGFVRRSRAFLLDLLFVSIPGALGWILYALRTSPNDPSLLTSPAFFLVTSGFATYGFLYFVLSEWLWGTTPGKRLFRLEVTNRRLGRPSILASIIRNTPKMIPLTAIGVGGALAALISEDYDVSGNLVGLVSVGPFVAGAVIAVGVGLPALVSGFTMMLSNESQRLGDLFAGTWVVRQSPVGSAPPPAATVVAAAPSAAG